MAPRLCFVTALTLLTASARAFATDSNVCVTLANVVSIAQERFDQAEIAFHDRDAICRSTPHPEACDAELQKEYDDSAASLASAMAKYKKAGCED